MGGSSLAPEVSARSFGAQEGSPRLHVLDSTDPAAVRAVEAAIDPQQTLFVVSTKSGGTIETLSLFKHFWAARARRRSASSRSPTRARARGPRQRARLPARVPQRPRHRRALQRAVVLRLVPGGAHGRRRRARCSTAPARPSRPAPRHDTSQANSGLWLGVALGELALRGRDKLTFVVDAPMRALRPVGRAARRRVDRQAGQGHPARRRRAARRAGRLRRRPRLRAPAQRRAPDEGNASAVDALATPASRC